MKKRVSNDIFINWTILRNEVAEDFSDAVNVKLVARIVNSKDLDITDFSGREGNVFYIRIPAGQLNIGTYTLILTYQKPDATIVGGFASHGLDIKNAFEVVRNSEQEDDEGRDITSDAHYAIDGATFIPAITEVGGDISLSWTNNRALPNPDPVILNGGVPEAVLAANNAATLANQKAGLAQEAADNANGAADNADSKAELATEKAILANQKATEANDAAVLANQRAGEALSATTAANTAAGNANTATQAANTATTQTLAAKSATEQATTQATTAADLANEKAQLADEKATLANNAATLANSKATLADEKATEANNAAIAANEKAGYANTQGDFAKEQGELAQTARENIEGDLGLKIDKTAITNELGGSEELVVSQKGVKNELEFKANHGYASSPKTLKQVDDSLVQLAGEVKVNIKNEIPNGSFEGTISGWYPPTFNVPRTAFAKSGQQSAGIVLSGVSPSTRYGYIEPQTTIGDVYYAKAWAYIITHSDPPNMRLGAYKPGTFSVGHSKGFDIGLLNQWQSASLVFTATIPNTRIFLGESATAFDAVEIYYDDVQLFNLSSVFGHGNEPTLEEFELLLQMMEVDYFEGEITIQQRYLMQWQLALIRKNKNAIIALGGTII